MFKNLLILETEQRNTLTSELSNLSTEEIIRSINYQDSLVADAVAKATKDIEKAVYLAIKSIGELKGRVIYFGAGTSGRIGILDASEIYPTYGVKGKFIGIIAGGKKALHTPLEGSEDNTEQAVLDLKKINFSNKDLLIGITASGRTPYVIAGLKYANEIGAGSVLITNNKNTEGSKIAQITIEALTGSEVITGSTRMKAGTAQKLICNTISTTTMVKLGYVESNYMINVVPTNQKLEQRCKNMIKEITHASDELIERVFNQTKNVWISLLMIQNNWDYPKAKKEYLKKLI
ncbi:N-acetylmuramic acid 6-phosphate etherase [Mycoplasma hafezii]|uniref:N-acetylmuramic acid 6-phosphate etherase n=1 Tax=Mycoplasma hafezii TaxID=525886 RepID=UPI003CF05A0B